MNSIRVHEFNGSNSLDMCGQCGGKASAPVHAPVGYSSDEASAWAEGYAQAVQSMLPMIIALREAPMVAAQQAALKAGK